MYNVDHYITNSRVENAEIYLTCPECNSVWTVEGIKEFGHFEPTNEDDMFCSQCNVAGVQ